MVRNLCRGSEECDVSSGLRLEKTDLPFVHQSVLTTSLPAVHIHTIADATTKSHQHRTHRQIQRVEADAPSSQLDEILTVK